MLKIVAVEYINTLPYITAIESSELLRDKVLLERTDPKNCAEALIKDEADLVLLPIGAILNFNELYCQLNFGIACDGSVGTVGIFSDKDWDEINIVKESASSRSSNLLLHTLNENYWKHRLQIIEFKSSQDFDATLIIGDEAFHAKSKYRNYYDLGAYWKLFANRPFLFALWMSKKILSQKIIDELNRVFEVFTSMENLKVLEEKFSDSSIENYLTQQIQYKLNSKHKESLQYFLDLNKIVSPIQFIEYDYKH